VDALLKEGHQVLIIDNLDSGKKENVNSKAEFYLADIRDEAKLTELFKGADGVFHTAALARIQTSFEKPDVYFDVNAVGTRNVLLAAKKNKVRRVVYSASSSAYGPREDLPLREEDRVASQALHPYGSTKRMGEMLMRDMGKATGGPETVCLRYFNVYGPRQNSASDGPYPTVIGLFADFVKQGKPLSVVPDGHQKRDFTHVSDVVHANILAMQSSKVGNGESIKIGTETHYSIWEVASMMLGMPAQSKPEDLLKNGKCVLAPERRGEVRATLADITKARELLGWKPTIKMEDGLRLLLTQGNKEQSQSFNENNYV
jgi:nucleoside-diphosphate-sugar epimerase